MGHPRGWPVLPRSALPQAGGYEGRDGCGCRFTNGPECSQAHAGPIRNYLPLLPVRWGHGYSLTVYFGNEWVRRPFSEAALRGVGTATACSPSPLHACAASITRTGAFSDKFLFQVNSYKWLQGHVECPILKICPISLQGAVPTCMSSGKIEVTHWFTSSLWLLQTSGSGNCVSTSRRVFCCSKTVWMNVI